MIDFYRDTYPHFLYIAVPLLEGDPIALWKASGVEDKRVYLAYSRHWNTTGDEIKPTYVTMDYLLSCVRVEEREVLAADRMLLTYLSYYQVNNYRMP
jgi:hypothetical protein